MGLLADLKLGVVNMLLYPDDQSHGDRVYDLLLEHDFPMLAAMFSNQPRRYWPQNAVGYPKVDRVIISTGYSVPRPIGLSFSGYAHVTQVWLHLSPCLRASVSCFGLPDVVELHAEMRSFNAAL